MLRKLGKLGSLVFRLEGESMPSVRSKESKQRLLASRKSYKRTKIEKKERNCLKCGKKFWSEGNYNWICKKCNDTMESIVPMPRIISRR